MKRIINNILEWIGYHFVGYKVDIKHLEKRIEALETPEVLQTPFNDNECNICDEVGRNCAELQTKLDEVVKEKKQYVKKYLHLMVKYKAIRMNEKSIYDLNEHIEKLVDELIECCNYGSFNTKDEIKEIITNHINLSDERGENA